MRNVQAVIHEVPNIAQPRTLAQIQPHEFDALPQQGILFDELWKAYGLVDPTDPIRILHLMQLMKIANSLEAGDYIELGTHRGLLARVIYRLMDPARTLYLLDTFEGFKEADLVKEREIYTNTWHEGNFEDTSPESVAVYVGGGTPPKNVVPIKGWFPKSFAGLENRRWRFIHIDFDLYQPIRVAVDMLWPSLLPGGVMIIHDYGCYGFPGAKIAVDEFAVSIGLKPLPLADRWGSVAFIKPTVI